MRRMNFLVTAVAAAMVVVSGLQPDRAAAQDTQQKPEVDRVIAATQLFTSAITARDIEAMDKVWAHEQQVTFIGPLSTDVVVGWEGVRQAWQMRFGQFDKVTISLLDTHASVRGNVAWTVGMERVQLLRKDGKTIEFAAFVTNVFEVRGGQWLMVAHQATPVFKPPM